MEVNMIYYSCLFSVSGKIISISYPISRKVGGIKWKLLIHNFSETTMPYICFFYPIYLTEWLPVWLCTFYSVFLTESLPVWLCTLYSVYLTEWLPIWLCTFYPVFWLNDSCVVVYFLPCLSNRMTPSMIVYFLTCLSD